MKHFNDSLNTAVFTTKFVIKEKKPITYVSHDDEDGAWQFFSDDDFEQYEDVAMLVSLEEIITIDNTVLQIADLPFGYIATRRLLNDNWTLKLKEDE